MVWDLIYKFLVLFNPQKFVRRSTTNVAAMAAPHRPFYRRPLTKNAAAPAADMKKCSKPVAR